MKDVIGGKLSHDAKVRGLNVGEVITPNVRKEAKEAAKHATMNAIHDTLLNRLREAVIEKNANGVGLVQFADDMKEAIDETTKAVHEYLRSSDYRDAHNEVSLPGRRP